jgi:hypothetical protein
MHPFDTFFTRPHFLLSTALALILLESVVYPKLNIFESRALLLKRITLLDRANFKSIYYVNALLIVRLMIGSSI